MITTLYNVHLIPLDDGEDQLYCSPLQLPPTPGTEFSTSNILSTQVNAEEENRVKDTTVQILTKQDGFIQQNIEDGQAMIRNFQHLIFRMVG